MAAVISRAIGDGERVGIGVNSPVPAAGALLARLMHAPNAVLRLPGSEAGAPFLGSKEFFDMAQRGGIDLFFLSGVQVDRGARLNLHLLGDHDRPARRFAGAFGSSVLYPVVGRTILFRGEHSPRTLVQRVDFVSAAPGNPDRLVTPRAVLTWTGSELELASVSPGETVESVRAATGWDLRVRDGAGPTPPPTEEELALLRGPVLDQVSKIYPRFAESGR